MASLIQDVWMGSEPRLRGRRLAPYEDAPVRIVFHPDLDQTLDEAELASFLVALGARVEVVAYEPRGQGGSAGRFGAEALDDLRALVTAAPRRWPDGRPLVLAGQGVGAALALAVAAETDVEGLVLLGPGPPAPLGPFLTSLDLPGRITALRVPVLAAFPRDGADGPSSEWMGALQSQPLATVLLIPGDRRAALRPPWPDVVAIWAAFAATAG
jgi:alpha-beta hydrolase superfamily lysophospholipase